MVPDTSPNPSLSLAAHRHGSVGHFFFFKKVFKEILAAYRVLSFILAFSTEFILLSLPCPHHPMSLAPLCALLATWMF